MFENDLNEFIAVQKKTYFLYYLRKNIKKRFEIIMNILII